AAPRRTLSWFLESESFRARVESAALVTRSTGELLMRLPISPGFGDIALHGSAEPYAGEVPFDRFFDLARSERISLVLETTLPDVLRLDLPFTLYRYKPWSQPFCS
ncbi:MAG: hypothetical protein HKM89_15730, partial [Gemmatimonadales bacterium]|nr:hypothetical protein [Gemmatimonadales bacterium]